MPPKRKAQTPAPAAPAAKKGDAGRGAGRQSGLAAAAQKEVEAALAGDANHRQLPWCTRSESRRHPNVKRSKKPDGGGDSSAGSGGDGGKDSKKAPPAAEAFADFPSFNVV